MPRSYGRIATSIWRDDDFRALTPHAKLAYAMLVTQAEISPAGLLDVTNKRWINQSGLSASELSDSLAELEKQRFIVVDDDTEELLVRSFVKWDGGAANDLRRRSIRHAAAAVQSPRLAGALAVELDKQGVSHALPEGLSKALPNGPSDTPSNGYQNTRTEPDTDELNSPSDSPTDTRRVVVKQVGVIPNPQPDNQSREPRPIADAIDDGAKPPPEFCSKHPIGTDDPCGPCASARHRLDAWERNNLARQLNAAIAAKEIRLACHLCDEKGFVLDPDTDIPVARCDHPTQASAR